MYASSVNTDLFVFPVHVWLLGDRGSLGIATKQVDVFSDVVGLTIRSSGLDQYKVSTLFDIFPTVGAIPSSIQIRPFIEFLSPSVEDGGTKLDNVLIFLDLNQSVASYEQGRRKDLCIRSSRT